MQNNKNVTSNRIYSHIRPKGQPPGRKSGRLQASIQGVTGASCELVHTEKDRSGQRVKANSRKPTHIRTKSDA